jgi:ClpP class serine protease
MNEPDKRLLASPSLRMLVDPEFLMQELMRDATVQAEVSAPSLYASSMRQESSSVNFIARVRLSGLIQRYNATMVADALYAAYANDEVMGVLLEVDTGGGDAVASQMIHSAVQSRNKPVVALVHYAASGGMLATMAADEIIASGPLVRVGSIGTMMSLPKWLAKVYNDYFQDVYADSSPEKNAGFRQYMDTMNTDKITAMLNELDEVFMGEMDKYRPLNKATKDETLAGGTWLAEEAKNRGLVDSIGPFNYAIKRLASHAATQNSFQ